METSHRTIIAGFAVLAIAACCSLLFMGKLLLRSLVSTNDCFDLGQAGKYDLAIPACREAVKASPGSAEAHNNLGYYLTVSGKPQEGLIECEKAVALNPNYMVAVDSLALAQALTNHPKEALENAKRGLADSAESSRQLTLGAALYANGRKAEAKEEWKLAAAGHDETTTRLATEFLAKYK